MNWTERMIRMRKDVTEIGWGDFSIAQTGKPEALALRYDWRNNSALFVHNLSPLPTEIRFGNAARWTTYLLSDDHSRPDAAGKHRILLEPYGYRWHPYLLNWTRCSQLRRYLSRLIISIEPFSFAPSSMTMRAAVKLPIIDPSFLISIRSRVRRFPCT